MCMLLYERARIRLRIIRETRENALSMHYSRCDAREKKKSLSYRKTEIHARIYVYTCYIRKHRALICLYGARDRLRACTLRRIPRDFHKLYSSLIATSRASMCIASIIHTGARWWFYCFFLYAARGSTEFTSFLTVVEREKRIPREAEAQRYVRNVI